MSGLDGPGWPTEDEPRQNTPPPPIHNPCNDAGGHTHTMKTKRQLLDENHKELIDWAEGKVVGTSQRTLDAYHRIQAMPDDPAPPDPPDMGRGINGAVTTLSNLTGMMHAKANGECNGTIDMTQIRILSGSIDQLAKAIAYEISKTFPHVMGNHKILPGENYDEDD